MASRSLVMMDPMELRYTQAACSPAFSDGRPLPDTFFRVVSGELSVGDAPAIRVYWYQGRWFSFDNRRLAVWLVLRMHGAVTEVPVFQMRGDPPPSFFRRLETTCGGEFILIRGVNLFVGFAGMFFMPNSMPGRILFCPY